MCPKAFPALVVGATVVAGTLPVLLKVMAKEEVVVVLELELELELELVLVLVLVLVVTTLVSVVLSAVGPAVVGVVVIGAELMQCLTTSPAMSRSTTLHRTDGQLSAVYL